MISVLDRISSLQAILPVFIDAALKGAILVAVAALAAYAFRKRSAASRHAVWSAAVIGHVAIPILILLLPAWRMPLLPSAPWIQAVPAPTMSGPAIGSAGSAIDVTENPRAIVNSANGAGQPTIDQKQAKAEPAVRSNSTSRSVAPGSSAVASTPISSFAVVATIWFIGAALVLLRLALAVSPWSQRYGLSVPRSSCFASRWGRGKSEDWRGTARVSKMEVGCRSPSVSRIGLASRGHLR